MKSKIAFAFSVATIAAAAIASPTTSYADDEKVFPGSVCHPVSVDTSAPRTFYSTGGIIVNWTRDAGKTVTDVARLHCPLTRDTVLKRWKRINVRVKDNSYLAHVKCTASNYSIYAGSGYNLTQQSGSTPSYRGHTTLTFYSPSGDYDRGAFNVYCELPGNAGSGSFSAILSINLVEE